MRSLFKIPLYSDVHEKTCAHKQVQALQFEWAWQHPEKSLALREAVADLKSTVKRAGLTGAKGKVAFLGVFPTVLNGHSCFFFLPRQCKYGSYNHFLISVMSYAVMNFPLRFFYITSSIVS